MLELRDANGEVITIEELAEGAMTAEDFGASAITAEDLKQLVDWDEVRAFVLKWADFDIGARDKEGNLIEED